MFKLITSLFAGPAGVVTDFFASFYGKLIGFLAITGIIVGLGTSVFFSFQNDIKAGEDAKLAAAQAQQLVKDKDAQIAQLKATQQAAAQAQADLQAAAAQATQNTDAVQSWIAQQPATGDRPASDVIKQTLDQLYGKAK
jgi:hypothetical protein